MTIQVTQTPTDVTITKDFLVYKYWKTHPVKEFHRVAARLVSVRSHSQNTYRTQNYYDVILISNYGNLNLVRLFQKEYDIAHALIKQIADFLHIQGEDVDE